MGYCSPIECEELINNGAKAPSTIRRREGLPRPFSPGACGRGVALSKSGEELEARVQKHTAQLTRANEALRQDAEQLSAIIATQHDIATARQNFMAVMH